MQAQNPIKGLLSFETNLFDESIVNQKGTIVMNLPGSDNQQLSHSPLQWILYLHEMIFQKIPFAVPKNVGDTLGSTILNSYKNQVDGTSR